MTKTNSKKTLSQSMKTLSQSMKIRRMAARANWTSRSEYSEADVTRWLSTDSKHLRKLVATLNCREDLNIEFVGKKLVFA
jgi:hypothetical protein